MTRTLLQKTHEEFEYLSCIFPEGHSPKFQGHNWSESVLQEFMGKIENKPGNVSPIHK